MKFSRAAGVLLHPTSLPGPNGIGELGPDAYRFLDFLSDAGLKIWQMLPLGPTGYGDSPYQCFSAFAGNPLLINVPGATSEGSPDSVDFPSVIAHKQRQFATLFDRFVPDGRYERFVQTERAWLDDYALFAAIKQSHNGASWTTWNRGLADRDASALAEFKAAHAREISQILFEQYVFSRQFDALRIAAKERGIQLMGDLPIYVAHDSADVWANREYFELDAQGELLVQAGVPPDYFSETGQLWGNPIYKWDVVRANGYQWWIDRLRAVLKRFDFVRLDHFRGFEAYWEVPGNATTAINGCWVSGPGAALFEALTAALGPLPIVAENLGLITPEVEVLRKQFEFPGMSILQFAFGVDEKPNEFLPHNISRESVMYTGTHDNDTTLGWWREVAGVDSTRAAIDIANEKKHALEYLDADGATMNWTLIRAALASVADTVLIPMQDILGLGSEARMNFPGRQAGNWKFRFTWEQLDKSIPARLRALTKLFDR